MDDWMRIVYEPLLVKYDVDVAIWGQGDAAAAAARAHRGFGVTGARAPRSAFVRAIVWDD